MSYEIAVSLVKAGFADFAKVSLGYVIGRPHVSVTVEGEGTLRRPQEEIHDIVYSNFRLSIPEVVESFGLRNPEIYHSIVAASDAFHNPEFPWNKPVGLHSAYKPGVALTGKRGGGR